MNAFRIRAAIAAAATLSLLALAACSSSSTSSNSGGGSSQGGTGVAGKVKILFQTGSQQQTLTDLAKKFESANPGTTVDIEFVPPANYQQTLLTRLRGGAGPDIFYANGGSGQPYSVVPLQKAGQLADLSGQPWTSTIPPSAKPLYTVDGKVWALPLALVPIGLAYNNDLVSKDGVKEPTTYQDLLDDCKIAKDKGVPLISLAGSAPPNAGIFGQMIASSLVYSKIPDWNTQRTDGKVTFAGTPEWVQTFQNIVDMKAAGCLMPGSEGQAIPAMFSSVANGQAISLPGPAGVGVAVQKINKNFKYGLWAFPGATADATRATAGYTDAFGVNAASKNKNTAIAFINFMAQPANATTFANAGATISLPDAATGTVPASLGSFGTYLKNNQTAALANQAWINGDVYSAMGTGVQGLLTGQLTPKQVLDQMDQAWAKGAPTK
jgi:raffinose/stachyose/melibiose transport system substrate-binding protein